MNYSLQSLSLSKLYENASPEDKLKLLDKLMESVELDDILCGSVMTDKIKEDVIKLITLTLGNNIRSNMINACIRQMKDEDQMLLYLYICKDSLKDMIKYQHPRAWIKYYMEGETMVVLREHDRTDKETCPFNFQRDIIDSKFNTSKLKKFRGINPSIWYSW